MDQQTRTAVIVIPTYNEADNIGKMIDYLCTKTFADIKNKKAVGWNWEMKILIVDDSSPDGTGNVVKEKMRIYPNEVFLLSRSAKTGLGSAYLDGFRYAIDRLNADYIFEFDGDFQHPPETIPLMLDRAEKGDNFVMGSRKIAGGSNPQGWGLWRWLLSEIGGGLAARIILFFPFGNYWKVTDPTSGLRLTQVKGYMDNLDLDYTHLINRSFGYKIETLYKTLALKPKYSEIPLKFGLRTAGISKIEAKTAIDILKVAMLLRVRDETTLKFIKFGLVGGFGFLINLFGLRFLSKLMAGLPLEVGVRNFAANASAAEVSIISNFIFNNKWTFAADKITEKKRLAQKFTTFNLSSILGGILIPSFIIGLGTQIWGDQTKTLFLFLAVFGFTIPFNWFVYNKFIWKK